MSPTAQEKMALVKQILTLGKKAKSVQNVVLVSSAGADYAERDKQPRLREFIDLEVRTRFPFVRFRKCTARRPSP